MKILKRWLLSLAACIGILIVYSVLRVGFNRLFDLPLHLGGGELVILLGMTILLWWVTRTIVRDDRAGRGGDFSEGRRSVPSKS